MIFAEAVKSRILKDSGNYLRINDRLKVEKKAAA